MEIRSSADIALLDPNGRSVRQDLGRALGDRRCSEAHIDDGVGAQLLGLCDHSTRRLRAAFLEQLGVPFELAANDVLEARREISAKVLRTDGAALYETEMLHDLATWHGVDYVLTWNVKHMANPNKRTHFGTVCLRLGLVPPMIVTPDLLRGLDDE